MLKIDQQGTVSMGELFLGHIDNPAVKDMVQKSQGLGFWSSSLTDWYNDVYQEFDRCPQCGRDHFHWHRAVTFNVKVGFCLECRTDIVKVDGKVQDLRTGKSGWTMSHPRW